MSTKRPTGMFGFTIVWFGQVVSLIGTAMSGFALTIWAWQITGSAEALALVAFFSFTPQIVLSPLAGALVDRWNRKLTMMLSDLAAGVMTIVVFALYLSGHLQIWQLYITGAITGAFQAFQWPAYSAAISTMVRKEQYVRANSMIGVAEAGSGIFAPLLAGALLALIGLSGILVIDIVTFLFAIGALMLVSVPQPPPSREGREGQGNLLRESVYGFRYIFARRSLLGLQLVFFFGNFLSSIGYTVATPMILARTGNSAATLGTVQSAFAVGGLLGGLAISAWGGPRRRVHGVLLGWALSGLIGSVVLGVGQALPVWLAGAFLSSLLVPLINSSNQAIWQAKVPPDLQGRVFSARRLIAQISAPAATLVAGFSAQRLFEPALMPGGALAPSLGWLVGSGPGAGMGLMLAISGVLVIATGLAGYLFPAVRNAEDLLPDHDSETPDAAVPAGETAAALS